MVTCKNQILPYLNKFESMRNYRVFKKFVINEERNKLCGWNLKRVKMYEWGKKVGGLLSKKKCKMSGTESIMERSL